MKTLLILTSFLGLCTSIYFKVKHEKLKISVSNELKLKSDSIISLKVEKFIKDSLIMDLEYLLINEKEAKRIKQIYFNR